MPHTKGKFHPVEVVDAENLEFVAGRVPDHGEYVFIERVGCNNVLEAHDDPEDSVVPLLGITNGIMKFTTPFLTHRKQERHLPSLGSRSRAIFQLKSLPSAILGTSSVLAELASLCISVMFRSTALKRQLLYWVGSEARCIHAKIFLFRGKGILPLQCFCGMQRQFQRHYSGSLRQFDLQRHYTAVWRHKNTCKHSAAAVDSTLQRQTQHFVAALGALCSGSLPYAAALLQHSHTRHSGNLTMQRQLGGNHVQVMFGSVVLSHGISAAIASLMSLDLATATTSPLLLFFEFKCQHK
ncbi:hypothetical protein B0H14DRAFT_2648189 [Mycena olivaceomarginata]|nr:hypothetical protein B0H14DRAFT_2648189 [Mycena olivaceomarginata]